MKKQKARHLWHGVFAFFILLSFFGAMVLLESQGSWITGFAVKEVSADSPVTATLGIGIPTTFRWQGQEYTLKANAISLGEGKVKLEVSKASVPSATAAAATASTPARTATPTTATTSTRTSTPISTRTGTTTPTTTARSSTTSTIFPTRTTTTPTTTSTRTSTTPTTTTRTASATILAKCQDKIDNDKDGKIDYPADRGCTSLKDNDETDTVTTTSATSTRTTTTTPTTTSTRTTTTTPTTTATRSTTTTTTSGSTVTGRATVSTTTTTATRSPITITSPTATSTTAARSTSTATTSTSRTTAAVSSSKKLGYLELLKTEEKSFDLDGDGTDDIIFTLLEVPSARQASVEIKIAEKMATGETAGAELTQNEVPSGEQATNATEPGTEPSLLTAGNVIYSNDLIDVNEILDEAGQPTASYEVTYHFTEIKKRIPFSFPCEPAGGKDMSSIFSGIADKVKAVYSYDPMEHWIIWNADLGGASNNLDEKISAIFKEDAENVKFFYGFFIVLKEPVELKITCTLSETSGLSMAPGWNLIALKGFDEEILGEVIAKTVNLGEANEFKEGKPQKTAKIKELKLQPGKAYWVNAKAETELSNPHATKGKK